jgi:hypothetical protein
LVRTCPPCFRGIGMAITVRRSRGAFGDRWPLPLSALESHHQSPLVVGRLLLLPLVLGDALTVDRAVFGNSGCLTGFCVFGSCMFGSLFANY